MTEFLHRELETAALACLFFLVQRGENADAHQHAGASVADRTARLDGRPTRLTGDAHRAAGGLRDHVESEALLVGAAFAKAFDLTIDDAGVDCLQHIIAEAETLNCAGGQVFGEHVG